MKTMPPDLPKDHHQQQEQANQTTSPRPINANLQPQSTSSSSSAIRRNSSQRPLIYASPLTEHQYASISYSPSATPSVVAQQARPLMHRSAQMRRLNAIAMGQGGTSGATALDKNGAPIAPIAIPPRRPTNHPASYSPTSTTRYLAGNQAPIVGAMSAKLDTGNSANDNNNRYAWSRVAKARAAAAAAAAAATPTGNNPLWASDTELGIQSPEQAAAGGGCPHDSTKFQYHFTSPFSSAASRVLVVNPMQIVNISEHTKSRLIKIIEALKRFSEKWFSHVLLLMFLAIYACLGAYVFISFEANTEQLEKRNIIEARELMVNETWKEAHSRDKDSFSELIIKQLEDYERLLNRACTSGLTGNSLENQWTFWGALFYSMTVFTTIGYGHLTPITFAGRVATMVYAIFGIPILLMVLADLGKLLTRIIKFAFKQFRNLYNKCINRKSSIRTRKMISDNTSQYMGVARDAFEGISSRVMTRTGTFRNVNERFARRRRAQEIIAQEIAARKASGAFPAWQEQDHARLVALAQRPSLQFDPAATELSMELAKKSGDSCMVVSDVIVTPAKQSKPVSPIVETSPTSGPQLLKSSSKSHLKQIKNQNLGGKNQAKNQSNRKTSTTSSSSSTKKSLLGAPSSGSAPATVATAAGANTSPESLGPSSLKTKPHDDDATPDANDDKKELCDNKLNEEKIDINREDKDYAKSYAEQQHSDIISVDNKTETNQPSIDANDLSMINQSGSEEVLEPEDVEDGEEEEEEDLDIPVSFALFLLVTYMMFGAVVFSIWEGWNFFDSLYFVFISMSTIGFGDLVPQHPKRMIGTFIYLLFGLALTSMCINVVQERIHSTFLRAKMQIGEKMGFDLDQIMADDYYHDAGDGGMAPEDGDFDDGNNTEQSCRGGGELAGYSIGESVSSSAIAIPSYDPTHNNNNNSKQSSVKQSASNNELGTHPPGAKVLKSQNSVKSSGKKRSVASLPGHGSQTGSNSIWRKSSKKNPASRNASPRPTISTQQSAPASVTTSVSQPGSPTISEQPESVPNATNPPTNIIPATPTPTPSPNAVESSLKNPLDQMLRDKETDAAVSATSESTTLQKTANQQPTGVRQDLINKSDQTNHQNGNSMTRPRLVSTRSQPNFVDLRKQSQTPTVCTSSSITNTTIYNDSQKSAAYESLIKPHSSASSSRRASVTLELNQLDELIMTLRSPSSAGRYGPLLGIPSRGQSSIRNNSSNSANSTTTNSNRRAYSTISRGTRSANATGSATSGTLRHSSSPRPFTNRDMTEQHQRQSRASICNPPNSGSSSAQSFRAQLESLNRNSQRNRPTLSRAASSSRATTSAAASAAKIQRDPNDILDEAIKAIQSSVM